MTTSTTIDQEILGWLNTLWNIWQLHPEAKRELFQSDSSEFDSNFAGIGDDYKQVNSNIAGYWGPIDTSVDWCETNYEVTYYIAEFFNTISSFPIIFWSIFGIYIHYKHGIMELRHIISFLSLGIVGLGSVAFHSTMRYYAQLLDELPMMIGMIINFYCLIEIKNGKNAKPNYKLIVLLSLLTIFEIICYVYFQFYAIFIASYIGLAAIMTYATVSAIHTRLDKKMYALCLLIYWGGIVIWNIEFYFCKNVQLLQFHALWHLCGGYGSYFYILLCVAMRQECFKQKPKLMIKPFAGHYIVIETEKKE